MISILMRKKLLQSKNYVVKNDVSSEKKISDIENFQL